MVNLGPIGDDMGYRPRTDPKRAAREAALAELKEERESYLFLKKEMNPAPGCALGWSLDVMIEDVDGRIKELDPPTPPPPRGPSGVSATSRGQWPPPTTGRWEPPEWLKTENVYGSVTNRLPSPNPRITTKGYIA